MRRFAPFVLSGGAGDPGVAGGHTPASQAGSEHVQRAEPVACVCRSGAFYRCFAAASYPAVWQLLCAMPPHDRHWYEVIREGRPAHLYFDLEYAQALNPQAGPLCHRKAASNRVTSSTAHLLWAPLEPAHCRFVLLPEPLRNN
jgi:hypothetical protein